MAAPLSADVLEDEIAISLARALAIANRTADKAGREASRSRITISQVTSPGESAWRINYGAQSPVGRRGGDLIIDVDARDATVLQVLRGQ